MLLIFTLAALCLGLVVTTDACTSTGNSTTPSSIPFTCIKFGANSTSEKRQVQFPSGASTSCIIVHGLGSTKTSEICLIETVTSLNDIKFKFGQSVAGIQFCNTTATYVGTCTYERSDASGADGTFTLIIATVILSVVVILLLVALVSVIMCCSGRYHHGHSDPVHNNMEKPIKPHPAELHTININDPTNYSMYSMYQDSDHPSNISPRRQDGKEDMDMMETEGTGVHSSSMRFDDDADFGQPRVHNGTHMVKTDIFPNAYGGADVMQNHIYQSAR